MDKTQFGKTKQYGAMLAIASHLHKRRLTTDIEHCKLIAEIQKKYRPAASPAIRPSPTLNNSHTEKVPTKTKTEMEGQR